MLNLEKKNSELQTHKKQGNERTESPVKPVKEEGGASGTCVSNENELNVKPFEP